MKKRKFKTKSNDWRIIDSAVIVIIFILMVICAFVDVPTSEDDPYFLTLLVILFRSLIVCVPMTMIYLAIKIPMKKNHRKNVIFEAVDDINYYRDNLGEMSPGLISFMIDLNVEGNRDITAMLLYLKSKNIIDIDNNNHIKINETYDVNQLKESDLVFLNWLKNDGRGYPIEWREAIEKAAYQEGYIKANEKNRISGCLFPIILELIMIVLMVLLLISVFNESTLAVVEAELASLPEKFSVTQLLMIVAGSTELLVFVIKILLCFILAVAIAFFPMFRFIYFFATNASKTRVKRTKLGNQLTERIYAMKNFINDFGNLSDATKEHLVLWDYFLIYAVVLEENDKIIDELSRYKNININKFIIDKTN